MRLAKLSFLAQALLLTAVAAQSADATDLLGGLTTDTTTSSSPETTTSSDETTTSTSSSTSSTSSETPTPTSESTSTTSTSSTTSSEISTTPSETSTTSSQTEPTKTSSDTSTTTSETSSTTRKPIVETITSYQTISGSTVPTVMTTTSAPAEATSPSLAGDSSASSSGVSESDKKIIIGVVVGVGGAIVLGVLGVVIWRIQKKRNEQYNDDDDDLMGGTAVGSGPREKAPSPAQAGTPFKSTLDQYHNPGPVNAASNF